MAGTGKSQSNRKSSGSGKIRKSSGKSAATATGQKSRPAQSRSTPPKPRGTKAQNPNTGQAPVNKRPANRSGAPKKNLAEPDKRGTQAAGKRREKVVSIESRRRKRGTGRGGAEAVVLGICMLFFVISIGGSLYKFAAREEVATMIVPYGSVDVPKLINGIIIRDETVYRSASGGEVTFNAADNEKVKSGAVVASIKNQVTVAALEAERDQLSKKILDLQEYRSSVSSASGDVAVINDRIKGMFDKNAYQFVGNDLNGIYNLKNNIETNIEYRNELLLNENYGTIQPYVDENRQYTNRIDEATEKLAVAKGGIVSYIIDGMEELIDFDSMDYITKEQTEMFVKVDMGRKVKEVAPEEEVFKIVNSNDWYIAAYIDNDLIKDWYQNNTVKIYIEKEDVYEEADMKVHKITPGETESYVLLKSTRNILNFMDMRNVSFKTHDSIYSGIKLPQTAIVERTFLKIPKSYVYNVKGNTVVLKVGAEKTEQIYITAKALKNTPAGDNFIYIMQDFNNIRRGDVITNTEENPETYVIEEIVTSKGVFKANNGVAVFASIDTDGMIAGNNGYVILDADNNKGPSGVNIYDRIVTDAASGIIGEGDIIY